MSAPILEIRLANYYRLRNALSELGPLYRGAFRDSIQEALFVLRNYAQRITHRQTGTLARSHTVFYNARALSGYVYPDPAYLKPSVQGQGKSLSASEYAEYEHARGGSHAFYERAMVEEGSTAAIAGINLILGYMPRGVIQ